jgi:hypothetical protein
MLPEPEWLGEKGHQGINDRDNIIVARYVFLLKII